VEEALAALWGAVLDPDRTSAADNFFARGVRGIDLRLHGTGDVVRAVFIGGRAAPPDTSHRPICRCSRCFAAAVGLDQRAVRAREPAARFTV